MSGGFRGAQIDRRLRREASGPPSRVLARTHTRTGSRTQRSVCCCWLCFWCQVPEVTCETGSATCHEFRICRRSKLFGYFQTLGATRPSLLYQVARHRRPYELGVVQLVWSKTPCHHLLFPFFQKTVVSVSAWRIHVRHLVADGSQSHCRMHAVDPPCQQGSPS